MCHVKTSSGPLLCPYKCSFHIMDWHKEADVCRPTNVCRGAAAAHKQVFVKRRYFYIRNCGLIKAAVLIQRNPNPSTGAALLHVSPLPPSSSRCRYYLRHLSEAAFVENWNCERGMSWLLTVTLRFFTQNSTIHSSLPRLTYAAISLLQVSSSHVWLHKHTAITFSFGSPTIFGEKADPPKSQWLKVEDQNKENIKLGPQ